MSDQARKKAIIKDFLCSLPLKCLKLEKKWLVICSIERIQSVNMYVSYVAVSKENDKTHT